MSRTRRCHWGNVSAPHPAEVSSRPVPAFRRVVARFALWLARACPWLYRRWAAAGNGPWIAVPPWTRPARPLAASRVALVSSGGIVMADQEPFDLAAMAGDPSWRVIPGDAELADVRISHLFYDHAEVRADTEVMLPLATLRRLAAEGRIGSVAPHHVSFSGSIPDLVPLARHSAPQIAAMMAADEVDLVLLVPA